MESSIRNFNHPLPDVLLDFQLSHYAQRLEEVKHAGDDKREEKIFLIRALNNLLNIPNANITVPR